MLVTRRTVEPAAEPITLDEAKVYLKDPPAEDDFLITTFIAAARQACEDFTGRALITQTWETYLDSFPCDCRGVKLWYPPLQTVSSITYVDTAGATQTLATSVYSVDAVSEPGRVKLAYDQVWPSSREIQNAIKITSVHGYGINGAAVPDALIAGMYLFIADRYEHRESVVTGTIVNRAITPEDLWWPHRIITI